MKKYFDTNGVLRERVEVERPTTITPSGMGLMMHAMIAKAKAKGNIKIYTDMTGDKGFTVKKENVC